MGLRIKQQNKDKICKISTNNPHHHCSYTTFFDCRLKICLKKGIILSSVSYYHDKINLGNCIKYERLGQGICFMITIILMPFFYL